MNKEFSSTLIYANLACSPTPHLIKDDCASAHRLYKRSDMRCIEGKRSAGGPVGTAEPSLGAEPEASGLIWRPLTAPNAHWQVRSCFRAFCRSRS